MIKYILEWNTWKHQTRKIMHTCLSSFSESTGVFILNQTNDLPDILELDNMSWLSQSHSEFQRVTFKILLLIISGRIVLWIGSVTATFKCDNYHFNFLNHSVCAFEWSTLRVLLHPSESPDWVLQRWRTQAKWINRRKRHSWRIQCITVLMGLFIIFLTLH